MKRLLGSSVSLNCVLLAVIGCLAMRDRGSRAASVRLGSRDAGHSFNWRQIETSDYPTYVQNLRTIGCPEETIRDIIAADVASLYEGRAVAAEPLGSTRLSSSTRAVTTLRRREGEPESLPQQAFISALLARPSRVDAGPADRSPNVEVTHDADYQWPARTRDFGSATVMNNRTDGGPSRVARGNSVDSPMPDETRQGALKSDTAVNPSREDVGSAVAVDQKDAASQKMEGLFTVDEQRYRSLYGWAAFYTAKQEQAVQAAAERE